MPDPMQSAYTDIPQSDDAQARAVFEALNDDPRYFVPENECERLVKQARALVKAGVLKGGEG